MQMLVFAGTHRPDTAEVRLGSFSSLGSINLSCPQYTQAELYVRLEIAVLKSGTHKLKKVQILSLERIATEVLHVPPGPF